LQDIYDEIQNLGAALVAVSPARAEFSRQLTKKLDLAFPILVDRDNALAIKFGLVFTLPEDLRDVYRSFGIDLERFNGNASWTLPIPARYLIDQQGLIQDAAVHVDYTTRPEPADTIAALRRLLQNPL
jgi:peroxiredoxin